MFNAIFIKKKKKTNNKYAVRFSGLSILVGIANFILQCLIRAFDL